LNVNIGIGFLSCAARPVLGVGRFEPGLRVTGLAIAYMATTHIPMRPQLAQQLLCNKL
jgi:hypothetical protein